MHQTLEAYFLEADFEVRLGVTGLLIGLILLATAPLSQAGGDSDTANERIPVERAQMEAHWKVDCALSWAKLIERRALLAQESCILPPVLQQQLQLCAYIYQPPGEQHSHTGNDYQAVVNGECDPSGVGIK